MHHIPGCLFGPDNIFLIQGNAFGCGGIDVRNRPSGDVVEQNRDGCGIGDGSEVAINAFLAGLVVIRSDAEDTRDACSGTRRGKLCDMTCVVSTRASDYFISANRFDNGIEEVELFVIRCRWRLARGPVDDKGIVAFSYQPLSKGLGAGKVDGAIRVEWRRHRRQQVSKAGIRTAQCRTHFLPPSNPRSIRHSAI